MVNIREFEKRLKALEAKGQEIEVIGHPPRSLRLERERALERILERLILTHRGREIVIAVTGVPQFRGDHLSLGLALQLPVGRRKSALSKQNRKLLEAFLVNAIAESARFRPPNSSASTHSRHGRRVSQGRASTGS